MSNGARDAAYLSYKREEQMRDMRKFGYNNIQIAQMLGLSRYKVNKVLGPMDKSERKAYGLYCRPALYKKAKEVARELGFFVRAGETTGQGSVSHLVEAIALGVVHVSRSEGFHGPKEWIHVPDIEEEAVLPGDGDGDSGADAEGPSSWEPGFFPVSIAGAIGDSEAGTEGVRPEHQEVLRDGGNS
jgi:hypothetical protein